MVSIITFVVGCTTCCSSAWSNVIAGLSAKGVMALGSSLLTGSRAAFCHLCSAGLAWTSLIVGGGTAPLVVGVASCVCLKDRNPQLPSGSSRVVSLRKDGGDHPFLFRSSCLNGSLYLVGGRELCEPRTAWDAGWDGNPHHPPDYLGYRAENARLCS